MPRHTDPKALPPSVIPVLFLVVCVLAAGGYAAFQAEKRRIHAETRDTLATIAGLKATQIRDWWQGRREHAEVLRASGVLAEEVGRVLGASGRDREGEARLAAWLERLRQASGYFSVSLLDPQGSLRLAAGGEADELPEPSRAAALEAVRTRKVTSVDLHLDTGGRIALELAAPLLGGPDRRAVTGVVLLSIDPSRHLYPLIQQWPTPNRTGEMLLVRREGAEIAYLNDLRHQKGAALAQRSPLSAPGSLLAGIGGNEEFLEGRDYRGVPSVAAARSIPGTSWHLVAKMDRDEIDRPIAERARVVAVVLGLLILLAATGAALIWKRRQSALYRDLFQGEVQRKALRQHLDWLTRHANDIILLSDGSGRIVEANERAVASYGYPREELIGMETWRLVDPSFAEMDRRSREKALGSGGPLYESVHRRKDGTTFPVEVSSRSMDSREGAGGHAQDIIRDITERREAAEELAHSMEEERRKNEELEAFTRTVAHDLRQPLTVIKGYVQFLRKALSARLDEREKEAFVHLLGSVDNANQFLEDLLVLSRTDTLEAGAGEIQVAPLMEEIAAAYSGQFAECRGILQVQEGIPRLRLNPARARTIFENLFSNSIKYSRPETPLVVRVGLAVSGRATKPGQVLLAFCDNGKGIPAEELPRIFEIFFRGRRESAPGTGLGLSIVKRSVEKAGGTIRVESVPGAGSTFFISLPEA